ncbi:hypothetical protein [Microtetraspora sp. NBRC 16547]|uniref:hypothetical protein n=1 Tax=Microtetraspora sp. NBRC 16547 TaxID=3030993 RepID=UPI0024A57FAA|nr:hypothetical protein [Microtetraspora sp. NBRC 16547]GLW96548.1 hypothetical protein Misp02_06350 [Microtetraspora sp. NBRC 16547]
MDLPDSATLLRWHGLLTGGELTAMGCLPSGSPVVGDWYTDPSHWSSLGRRLTEHVSRRPPLDLGITVDAAAQLLGLPDRRLAEALLAPPLMVEAGRILPAARSLLPSIAKAVAELVADLAARPFHAPTAERLDELGLTGKALAAALRSGAVTSIGKNVVLLPGASAAPWSRAVFQLEISEEYRPSRRSSAPLPALSSCSYSCRIRALYAAEYRRAVARSRTCGSGVSGSGCRAPTKGYLLPHPRHRVMYLFATSV